MNINGSIPPRAMTVAGSDSGGGAGIQADIKAFTSLEVFGTSAITAITSQNTVGVHGVVVLEPEVVVSQMRAILSDIGTDAMKTGMLANAGIISAVAGVIREFSVSNVVIDPVMIAKSGDPLLAEEAVDALVKELLPLATVITPNLHEAAALTGITVDSLDSMRETARRLHDLGPAWVVVKGGHLSGEAIDMAYDGRDFHELQGRRYDTPNTHGTGCTFSAAITAGLARGLSVLEAIKLGKDYITWAIANAPDLGRGHGPTNHFYFRREVNE